MRLIYLALAVFLYGHALYCLEFNPVSCVYIKRDGYCLLYDFHKRNAILVYEKLSKSNLKGRVSRDNIPFKEDAKIYEIFRTTIADYKGSGFDRGHLAPAANHTGSLEKLTDTFLLSNIAPQNPSFNRGYWSSLEKHARSFVQLHETVEVFSGPLFLPQADENGERWVKYRVIGENDIAVPTHFFKIIVLDGSIDKAEAYILPNEPIHSKKPLEGFKTTVEKVERVAGIKLFN